MPRRLAWQDSSFRWWLRFCSSFYSRARRRSVLDMANTLLRTRAIPKKFNLGYTLARIALYITVAVVSLLTIFPIYWMLVSTFQPSKYTLHYPPPLFPQEITLYQFSDLFANHPIALWLRNSFLIASMSMLLCTALTVLGAYALSSLRWKGRST